ncbi:helix-turn-helix domain-containing protein [Dyella caseinilytica]|uniref:Helix-turn-helix domain-containing protein n=1 Tax=Dyella caseinilytica TaxID=1849581 RepID=A0ABX7GYP4_9GAMM|nr:helix-turn-helix domain-containing protein [Dyella caseinilytica]QRN55594.1 helix-turn-helix domain-containing protein [Dyella caseinilytica]GGA02916.1 hypothetical protein GCM10011408_25510 [Dyella caseinilytica]
MPKAVELTVQMAADLLNVSQPHLVSLIERAQIPCHQTDTGCQLLYASDVFEYKQKRDSESLAALQELAAQAQELDLGYQLPLREC